MVRSHNPQDEGKRLYALPVIGADEQFLGEIRLKDVLRLRKEGVRDISSIVMKEVPSVLESMTVRRYVAPLAEGPAGFAGGR